ncbi:ATP-binding protein [Streptomyces albofaciens JCM 4342]|uniref:ATP-binding protein n=1 Tax=Streptomyces albofaciens TaxID=66866 RepID=UPI0012387496|nr:ATP-binding protein [Streptomyces albofaciens]KAA6214647.1 ATP-binding protein [Streptomyces albofaciens JCM 4342]
MATVSPPQNWAYTLQLPRSPGAPRIARVILRAALDHHGMEELTEVAELLTSELVTNAYQHTDGPSSVRVRRVREDRVRVSVWDTDPVIPASFDRPVDVFGGGPGAAPDAEAGRGLLLVRLCAANWGGHPIGAELFGLDGKALWFELVTGRDAFDVAA